jgi:hypothetical protein
MAGSGNQQQDRWLDANTRIQVTPNENPVGAAVHRELLAELSEVYGQPRQAGTYEEMYAMEADPMAMRDIGRQSAKLLDPRRSFYTTDGGAAFGNPSLGRAVGDPEVITRTNARIDAVVAGAEDFWVQQGGVTGYLGYLGAQFVPRSVEGWAGFIVSGPVIGEAFAVGLPGIVRAVPLLGREVGGVVDSVVSRIWTRAGQPPIPLADESVLSAYAGGDAIGATGNRAFANTQPV